MSFFSKLFQPKNENSVRYKRFMANKINNRSLKYVTERDEDNRDIVIGKGGAIHVRDDGQLIVYGGGSDVLFRADVDTLTCAELMSLDGVILEGYDYEKGRERKIVAHYLYYRK